MTLQGQTPTKAAVCQEIKTWAKHLGAREDSYTGHSLRTTGAQRLAVAGVSEEMIRLFGRWSSSAMLNYVRDSLLADSGIVVSQFAEGRLGSNCTATGSEQDDRGPARVGGRQQHGAPKSSGTVIKNFALRATECGSALAM